MLQITLIGNIGADAAVKNSNGREFTTFRVAHTDKWTDDAGGSHESTIWVDCLLNEKPKVVEYLKKGTLVFVQGSAKLRVYSSEKDRCMKAGLQISVSRIELLGGKPDDIPGTLYSLDGQKTYSVGKYYNVAELVNEKKHEKTVDLVSKTGQKFRVDGYGWVVRLEDSAK